MCKFTIYNGELGRVTWNSEKMWAECTKLQVVSSACKQYRNNLQDRLVRFVDLLWNVILYETVIACLELSRCKTSSWQWQEEFSPSLVYVVQPKIFSSWVSTSRLRSYNWQRRFDFPFYSMGVWEKKMQAHHLIYLLTLRKKKTNPTIYVCVEILFLLSFSHMVDFFIFLF